MKHIKLGSAEIRIDEYASQGNGVLGIRDSGKSYTSMVIGEQLIDAGIPIIAFDPIGIWRFLRVPGKGKGYPVVIAGGEEGDFKLTPESAPKIVEAAMMNNISLIIDLFSMDLSKADWKRIVEASVRLLLHNNRKYGLRHIFIEEAAEFAPQRVGPDQGRVYAEIEKLARMGGNSMLGYTLINQRAEEVNKAVLELCDCMILHRQKGRNSLTALGKWLDITEIASQKEIIKSLPLLEQGQCWVWSAGSDAPKRVNVQQKNSFHPDRRKLTKGQVGAASIDVDEFVGKMKQILEKDPPKKALSDKADKRAAAGIEIHSQEIDRLTREKRLLTVQLKEADNRIAALEGIVQRIHSMTKAGEERTRIKMPAVVSAPGSPVPAPATVLQVHFSGKLPLAERKILTVLAQYPDGRSKTQAAVLTGYSVRGGGFNNALGALNSAQLIDRNGEFLKIRPSGLEALGSFEPLPVGRELFEYWLNNLPAAERKILGVLYEAAGAPLTKQEIADRTGYQASGGGFNNAIGKLRTLELITGRNEIQITETLL